MGRHLETHLRERTTGVPAFHLSVDGGGEIHWMHLILPASATLRDLDLFLRYTWLECCGHLSAFTINGISYDSHKTEDPFFAMLQDGDRDMAEKLGTILVPGLTFSHEYDFGTTTSLRIRVISAGTFGKSGKKQVELLVRNDPPDIRCETCGAKATVVCGYCQWNKEAWFCNTCSKKHAKGECGEDSFLPVVNSPRAGQCAYEG